MKRIGAIILAGLLLLPLAACGKKQDGAGNAAAYPPGDMSFHPETDYDNRYGGLYNADILETEDAYYMRREGHDYILYYDKATGDSGFLCPRPDCVHDEIPQNKACTAYMQSSWATLSYYEGRLWWVQECQLAKTFGIFRMNTDGSEKTLVKELEYSEEIIAGSRFFFHRGKIYCWCCKQQVLGGEPYHKLFIGYLDMDDFEYHPILERDSFHTPVPALRFVGDYVYILMKSDGIKPGEIDIPDSDIDPEGYLEVAKSIVQTNEVMRWKEGMGEPEVIYSDSDWSISVGDTRWFAVTRDGVPYAVDSDLLDPEQPFDREENPYYAKVYRLEPDGTQTLALEMKDGSEAFHTVMLTDGLILAVGADWEKTRAGDVDIWIRRFSGETVFKGKLPLEYRKDIKPSPGEFNLEQGWVTEDALVLCLSEYYAGNSTHPHRYFFVKYDITADGLKETLLAECQDVIGWFQ